MGLRGKALYINEVFALIRHKIVWYFFLFLMYNILYCSLYMYVFIFCSFFYAIFHHYYWLRTVKMSFEFSIKLKKLF